MKRCFIFLVLLLGFSLIGQVAMAYGDYDLNRAHRMRNNGDFGRARNLYRDIALSYSAYREIRQEAGYYMGFCSVRMNNSWTAIDDFKWFLRNFDRGPFVPDAMYVLGRTYEEVGRPRDAKYHYRECIRRFRYGEFPDKSRQRLRYLGDTYYFEDRQYADSPETVTVGAKEPALAESKNDPYNGLVVKHDQIDRVNKFLEAVDSKKNVGDALRSLTKADASLSVVKEKIQMMKESKRFETLHESK